MSNNELTNDEKDAIESKVVESDLDNQSADQTTEESTEKYIEEPIEETTKESHDAQKDMVEEYNEKKTPEQTVPAPVVVKKGGFFSFLTFLLSVAALGVSAFLYYQQYMLDQQKESSDPQWQQSLADMDAKFKQQMGAFRQQLNSIKSNNQQLTADLKSLQEAQQKNLDLTQQTAMPVSTTAYDDSEIKQQITAIERQIAAVRENSTNQVAYDDVAIQQKLQALEIRVNEENKNFSALQNAFELSQAQQKEKIQQLFVNAQKQQQNQTNTQADIDANNHKRALIASTLQASQIQLNINKNVEQSLNLLTAAQQQLRESQQQSFVTFADELSTFMKQIKNIPVVNDAALHQQINDLINTTDQLSFAGEQAENSSKQGASWFDNLITVRKIADDNETLMTAAEQQNIRNEFKAHFGLLKNALINKNQVIWSSQITQIDALLEEYFASGSNEVRNNLQQLNSVVLNPVYPDLSEILKRFNAISIETSGD